MFLKLHMYSVSPAVDTILKHDQILSISCFYLYHLHIFLQDIFIYSYINQLSLIFFDLFEHDNQRWMEQKKNLCVVLPTIEDEWLCWSACPWKKSCYCYHVVTVSLNNVYFLIIF